MKQTVLNETVLKKLFLKKLFKKTTLSDIISRMQEKIVQLLVEKKININNKNSHKLTLLCLIITFRKQEKMMQLLFKKKADINAMC